MVQFPINATSTHPFFSIGRILYMNITNGGKELLRKTLCRHGE
jgi:hypothetical protein